MHGKPRTSWHDHYLVFLLYRIWIAIFFMEKISNINQMDQEALMKGGKRKHKTP